MKFTVQEKVLNTSFLEAYNTIKEQIVSHGFLLLHEIDTTQIVSKHGIDIAPLKQLLFFDPKYISQIMDSDYLAINDIPLKFVISYKGERTTSISYQNPAKNLTDYNLKNSIKEELLERVQALLEDL
ncbi:DUF302 domain-containing protein [Pontimicrobium aquaticum]|uniref:DUF302 domain-containing protein n=1 Tax=Pontimicrobium aquaticum TaxID=2565367 RepID=A0A4U0EP35_9FLAO|nr:DUF302 domain-containing protein [Pontimicrobium aquaticum]TJY33377.1 DUF302 domain-containing protein [Pontimicrobium aquaticum]